ncbi:unnamed protein product [Phaeothamnion confervicola]
MADENGENAIPAAVKVGESQIRDTGKSEEECFEEERKDVANTGARRKCTSDDSGSGPSSTDDEKRKHKNKRSKHKSSDRGSGSEKGRRRHEKEKKTHRRKKGEEPLEPEPAAVAVAAAFSAAAAAAVAASAGADAGATASSAVKKADFFAALLAQEQMKSPVGTLHAKGGVGAGAAAGKEKDKGSGSWNCYKCATTNPKSAQDCSKCKGLKRLGQT